MLALSFYFLCYVLIQLSLSEFAWNQADANMQNKKVTQTREHNIEFCIRQRDSQKIGAVGKVTIVEA